MIATTSSPVERRSGMTDACFLAAACFALRAVSLVRSCLSDDEAIYAVVAREMLAGRVLYRDVVDHKPPLIYVVYAATQALGGPKGGMALLHVLTILVVLATALLLGRIVRQFGGRTSDNRAGEDRAPFHAALLYVVFTTTLLPFDSLAANCELFMMLPVTASVLLFLRGAGSVTPRLDMLAGAGALAGVAAFFKYQGAIQMVLYAGTLAVMYRRRVGRALLGCAVMGAGLVFVLALAAVLLRREGSLDAAWFWFRFNFSYIKEGLQPLDTAIRATVRVSFVAGSAAFLWALGIAAALKAARFRGAAGEGSATFSGFAAGWLAVSALATTAGGRFFGHYFHQVTAPLAVLAAPAVARLWRSRRRLVVVAMGVPAASFILIGVFQARVMAAAGKPEPDYAAMARFIDTHAQPGDSLVIWGNLPVLYFAAERPLGTRFVFSNYLTGLSPATRSQSDPGVDASANIVPESWDMFEADLAARRPRLFVDTSPGNVAEYGKFPPSRFPRLSAVLARDYRPLGEIAGVRVLERVGQTGLP